MFMNKMSLILLVVSVVSRLGASPWNYDSASEDVKEYIVDSMTNCVGRTDILLLHSRDDDILRVEDYAFPCGYVVALGMDDFRCVDVLMGDTAIGGYTMIYVYEVPRSARTTGGRDFPDFEPQPLRNVP